MQVLQCPWTYRKTGQDSLLQPFEKANQEGSIYIQFPYQILCS